MVGPTTKQAPITCSQELLFLYHLEEQKTTKTARQYYNEGTYVANRGTEKAGVPWTRPPGRLPPSRVHCSHLCSHLCQSRGHASRCVHRYAHQKLGIYTVEMAIMHSVREAQNLCIITYMQHQVQVSISRKECSDLLGIKKPINHSLFCAFTAHLLQAALELAYSLYKI